MFSLLISDNLIKHEYPSLSNKKRQNISPPWPLPLILALNIALRSADYKDSCAAVASFPTILTKFSEKVISILLEMKILFGEDS